MKNSKTKLLKTFPIISIFLLQTVGCQNSFSNDSSIEESNIEIISKNVTIKEGETYQLEYNILDGNNAVFESYDEEIASITTSGLILGNNVGKTTIAILSGESKAECSVDIISAKTRLINGKESKLVWSDEFNGTSIDTSVWGFQLGVHDDYYNDHGVDYWGNNEKQAYTDKNAKVENGHLIITAQREELEVTRTNGNPQTMQFTSSRMLTRNKKVFKYGYIEAKFKTPCITGMWPAFWMMPEPSGTNNTANEYGGWCSSGEIDIFEARGSKPTEVLMTLHFGSGSEHRMSNGDMNLIDSTTEKWHTYAVNWREDFIEWYIDGTMYHRTTSEEWYSTAARDNPRAPFDKEFYVLFNLAVGGNFDSNRLPPADFESASMVIDYLRYYE